MPLRESAQLCGHLLRELSGGAEDQALSGHHQRVYGVEDGQPEGGCLSAAGLGLARHVLPMQHGRQGLGLDGGHLRIGDLLEGLEELGAEVKRAEGLGHGIR